MPSYSKNKVVLIRNPFSNLSGSKIKPAIVVGEPHQSQDLFVVPLTSRNARLLSGEFLLANWAAAGLNVPSEVKRGLFTIHQSLVVKAVGSLFEADAQRIQTSLREWLGL